MQRYAQTAAADSSIPSVQTIAIVTPDVTTFAVGDTVACVPNSLGAHVTCTTPTTAMLGAVSSAICSDADFGVVTELLSNGNVKVCLRGRVSATVLSTANAAIGIDSPFIPNTSKQLELDQSAVNVKFVALATAAVSGGSTATPALRTVWFDGLNGFGRYGGTAP